MTRETGSNYPPSEVPEQLPLAELAGALGAASMADTEGHTSSAATAPLVMFGPMMPTHPSEREAAETARVEALQTLDKDNFRLGNLNPLIHPPDLTNKELVEALRYTTLQKIREHKGLLPTVLESGVVTDPESKKSALRFIARFEIPRLTEKKMELLEELVKQTYGVSVRTRTDSKGNDIPVQSYPPAQPGEEMRSKTGGWYMGPEPFPACSLHQGLYVFRDYGPIDKGNFLDDSQASSKYIVEVRESSQYQTDLVTFVTQVASVLGQEVIPDGGELLYETYYDLIRLGLKKADEESIYGMEEAAGMIRRELILPLASPLLSGGVGEEPQSVLMIGVPGTGKTLLVERLLQEETGLFILPIDPFELQKEVAQPVEKQYLLPRIAQIANMTGKRVVLHVDDIENMVGSQEATNSTILNLMAGVQENGFYIIASTNYPEKINPSLIQPGRFSVLIHCGLHDERARYEILKIHAEQASKNLKMPLFSPEEVRDLVLHEIAKRTPAFTPRYLANIATIAKSRLIDRVARAKNQIIGLTEADLEGHTFTSDDWVKALEEVSAKYDSKGTAQRDRELAAFVRKHSGQFLGFLANGPVQSQVFSPEVLNKVRAMEAKLAAKNNAAPPKS